jgi:hypothetical protein
MVSREDLDKVINERLNQVLLIGQSSVSASQYQAFRKLILNEFGRNGLAKELDKLFGTNTERHGTGRNRLCEEGGAS